MDKYAIIISGPSGCGKTTVAEELISAEGNLEMSRSATTRERRADGKEDEYVYVSVEEFERSIAEGDVLEGTKYSGNYYGTRKSELDRIFAMGKCPILVLDYVGVKSLRERLDYPVYAFYIYTSLEEAERRLSKRDMNGEPSEKAKATFLRRRAENIKDYSILTTVAHRYDAFVENRDLDTCVSEIRSYIRILKSGCEAMPKEKTLDIAKALGAEAAKKQSQ